MERMAVFAFHVSLDVFHVDDMIKRNDVKLTADERDFLEEYVREGAPTRFKRARASILLMSDAGASNEEIADELEVGTATVERVRRRFVQRGVAGCIERKTSVRMSRARKFDGDTEAKLVQIACSKPPAGRARWTLSLLGDKLVELQVFDTVSNAAIHRTLKKTKLNLG